MAIRETGIAMPMKAGGPPANGSVGSIPVAPLAALGCAALALGMSAIFVKLAAVPGAGNGFYRMAIATVVLAIPVAAQARRLPVLPRRHLLYAVLAGVLFACDLLSWNTGVLIGSATNATLLANTSPVWVALGVWLLFGERLPAMFWGGLAVALAGTAVVVGRDVLAHPGFARGDLLGLLAGFFYGLFFLPSQRARERLPALFAWWVAAVSSAAVLLLASLALGQPLAGFPPRSFVWLAAVALVTQVGGYLSIAYALGHLPASLAAPALLLQPVITALLAVPLLGERLGAVQVLGGALVLAGMALVHRAHRR